MRNKQVWAVIVFAGFQSLLFYTAMTWLPTMAIHAGLSSHEAGLLTSIFSLISIPFSMTIPSLTTSLSTRNRQLMLTLVSLAGVVGISMLFFPIGNFFLLARHPSSHRNRNQCPLPLSHGQLFTQDKRS